MATTSRQHDRITVLLPHGYSRAIKSLATELDLSQSELITQAFDSYWESQQKRQFEKIARSMVDEYRENTDLVTLTSLDGEDFK
ncbi:MAG: hypothetical protein ACLPX5_14660 [Dissulfurispiraceae bacterium]